MKDYISTEEQINKRIAYIEALCKNIIDSEIEKYLAQKSCFSKE